MLIVIWFVLGVLFFLPTITVLHMVRTRMTKKSRVKSESEPLFI